METEESPPEESATPEAPAPNLTKVASQKVASPRVSQVNVPPLEVPGSPSRRVSLLGEGLNTHAHGHGHKEPPVSIVANFNLSSWEINKWRNSDQTEELDEVRFCAYISGFYHRPDLDWYLCYHLSGGKRGNCLLMHTSLVVNPNFGSAMVHLYICVFE